MVEEQCEVVSEENWGSSFISLTVDGQNNVIFLDENGATEETVEETGATLVVEEKAPALETRQTTANIARPKRTRRTAGSVSPMAAAASSNEVDLLSFVHNAGVMVQHILDIQSDNSTP